MVVLAWYKVILTSAWGLSMHAQGPFVPKAGDMGTVAVQSHLQLLRCQFQGLTAVRVPSESYWTLESVAC